MEAGAIVLPACPGFYQAHATVEHYPLEDARPPNVRQKPTTPNSNLLSQSRPCRYTAPMKSPTPNSTAIADPDIIGFPPIELTSSYRYACPQSI